MALKIIIDVILCAVILFGTIFGIKRGFINIAARPVKFFAALAGAIALCGTFANAVVTPIINAPITNYVSDFLQKNCASLTAENISEELPTLLKIAAAVSGIDINSFAGDSGASFLDTIVNNLTAPVINVVSNIISFIVLFFILKLILGILLWVVNMMFKNGVLGVFNKALGFVFGACCSVITAWALAVVVEFVFHTPALQSNELIATFDGGIIYRFFNTYSPIEILLSF